MNRYAGLSMKSRAEITIRYAKAYARASKQDKGRMLDEVVAVTGWSRDNARRRLVAAAKTGPAGKGKQVLPRPRKPRAPKYSYAAVKVLQRVWAASGGQCGKYLAASMRIQLDGLERYGELVPGKDQVRRLGARRAAGDERGHDRPVSGAGAGQGRDHGQVHDEVVAAGVSYR